MIKITVTWVITEKKKYWEKNTVNNKRKRKSNYFYLKVYGPSAMTMCREGLIKQYKNHNESVSDVMINWMGE